jgi:hypothetical protein
MWSGGNIIGSFWKPCHFVPLIPHTVECSTINIDDYENVFNLISDEAFSWPNNTKEKALKKDNYHLP